MAKLSKLKNSIFLFSFLFIVWGFYRLLFQLPEEIEELVIKPVIWLGPTFYLVFVREKQKLSSLGVTAKNLFPAIYFALALGILFALEAVVINFVKYGGFNFGANIGDKPLLISLLLSFATAISEEISFRGYIFNRIWQVTGKEWASNLITSLAWALIHLPVTFFVLNLGMAAAMTSFFLTFLFGLGSAFVFARTKNVASSIFLHVLWEWPIILFR